MRNRDSKLNLSQIAWRFLVRLDDSFITSVHLTMGCNTFLIIISITYINATS